MLVQAHGLEILFQIKVSNPPQTSGLNSVVFFAFPSVSSQGFPLRPMARQRQSQYLETSLKTHLPGSETLFGWSRPTRTVRSGSQRSHCRPLPV